MKIREIVAASPFFIRVIRLIRGCFRFSSGHEWERIVCGPSRNCHSRQFVNKRHVLQELQFGVEKNLRAPRRFELFVLRTRS